MIGYKIDWSKKYEYLDICDEYLILPTTFGDGSCATIRDDAPEEAKVAFEKLMAILDDQALCKKETGDSVRF